MARPGGPCERDRCGFGEAACPGGASKEGTGVGLGLPAREGLKNPRSGLGLTHLLDPPRPAVCNLLAGTPTICLYAGSATMRPSLPHLLDFYLWLKHRLKQPIIKAT